MKANCDKSALNARRPGHASNRREGWWRACRARMVCVLFALTLTLTSCGDDEASSRGDQVGAGDAIGPGKAGSDAGADGVTLSLADDEEQAPAPAPSPTNIEAVADAIDPGSPLGQGLAEVARLREAGEFAQATRKVRELEEAFSDAGARAVIRARADRLRRDRRESSALAFSIEQLGSADPGDVDIATRSLLEAGDLGMILLARAVRGEDETVALRAGEALSQAEDPRALDAMLQHFLTARGETRTAWADAIDPLAGHIDERDIRRLYGMALPDPDYQQRDFVQLLGAAIERGLDGEADAFNRIVADDRAFEKLSTYVQEAYLTGGDDVSPWALEQAHRFAVLLPGIRGRYFRGSNFDTELTTRLDETLEMVGPESFNVPGGDEQYFSVQWEGQLLIEQPGEYALRLSSDDGHRLWIDGELLVDFWNQGPHYERVMVRLDEGLHDLRLHYQQEADEAYVKLSWRGPGVPGEEVLDDRVLRFAPRGKTTAEDGGDADADGADAVDAAPAGE